MENGERRMENGERRMENKKWEWGEGNGEYLNAGIFKIPRLKDSPF